MPEVCIMIAINKKEQIFGICLKHARKKVGGLLGHVRDM
jgi:hypothetical protein